MLSDFGSKESLWKCRFSFNEISVSHDNFTCIGSIDYLCRFQLVDCLIGVVRVIVEYNESIESCFLLSRVTAIVSLDNKSILLKFWALEMDLQKNITREHPNAEDRGRPDSKTIMIWVLQVCGGYVASIVAWEE